MFVEELKREGISYRIKEGPYDRNFSRPSTFQCFHPRDPRVNQVRSRTFTGKVKFRNFVSDYLRSLHR